MPRLLAVLLICCAGFVRAEGAAVPAAAISAPAEIGAVKFRWLGFSIYDAELFTQDGKPFSWARPMALRLTYAMRFSKNQLMKGTMAELDRMEGTQPDHAEIAQKLAPCYAKVGRGDQFVAATKRADEVTLWRNGVQTCTLKHKGIHKRFLGIWLSDQSRDAALSRRLRGQ